VQAGRVPTIGIRVPVGLEEEQREDRRDPDCRATPQIDAERGRVPSKPLTHAHRARDHRQAVERIFTLEEANAALADLRPIVERMVEHRRNLTQAQRLQAELVTRIAGNGGDMSPSDLREAAATIQQEAAAIAECAEQVNAIGAQIKSLEEGLLDFPARRGDEDVLLCWKLGEDEIRYWHGVDEGFAGRKPLPL
jgi:hypothetical protein